MKNFGKKSIFFIIQNEFVSSKMHNIPCFDTFPKNNFYKNYLKGQAMTLLQEGGQPYNPCGFVSDRQIDLYTYLPTYTDSKMTNFATLRLRKVKEIGLIATTRFEDLDLNCGLG